jgi:glutathione synthase/RimK-type ligase-like ATP-grasp enzyme
MNIYAYKSGSQSAKALSEALDVRRIKHENSKFKGHRNKVVINWGASEMPNEVRGCKVLNAPFCVAAAMDKLNFFKSLTNHLEGQTPIIPYTEDKAEAIEWADNGKAVVCRTLLRASGGRGIVMADKGEEVVDAPLYTQYVKKRDEYRVHVFQGEVIHKQRKARKLDVENPDWRIRNHENGFIFQIEDFEMPQCVADESLKMQDIFDLDFYAADVIYNAKEGKAYVLEINTAPGLEGTTLEKYVTKFNEIG